MLAIGRLAVAPGRREQRFAVDPALCIGDFLQRGNFDALTFFDELHKVGRIHQAVHGAGIQPGKAAAHHLGAQGPILEIQVVKAGDFQLPTGTGLDTPGKLRHPSVIEIQPGDAVIALIFKALGIN